MKHKLRLKKFLKKLAENLVVIKKMSNFASLFGSETIAKPLVGNQAGEQNGEISSVG